MTLYVGLYQDRAWYDQPTNYSPKITQMGLFNFYVGFYRCLTALTYSIGYYGRVVSGQGMSWVLSKLTTCGTSLNSIERSYFPYIVFSSLSPDWFFIRGGECHKLIIHRTVQWCFWQVWLLHMWWGQTIESGLRWWAHHIIKIWGGRSATSSPWCRTAFLHRRLVLDRPNMSGFICIYLEFRARCTCIRAY